MTRSERGAVSVLAVAIIVLGCALALGEPPTVAAAVARESARENGARLLACECAGRRPTVQVQVGAAHARARAEVRFECFADPVAC